MTHTKVLHVLGMVELSLYKDEYKEAHKESTVFQGRRKQKSKLRLQVTHWSPCTLKLLARITW